jgi:hypothetical protein
MRSSTEKKPSPVIAAARDALAAESYDGPIGVRLSSAFESTLATQNASPYADAADAHDEIPTIEAAVAEQLEHRLARQTRRLADLVRRQQARSPYTGPRTIALAW